MGVSTKEKGKFRIGHSVDKTLVHRLHEQIFPEDEWFDEDSVDWVVFSAAGQPVGFCMLAQWDKKTAYMARAGVMKACQGYGLHRRLILTRERYARALGFETIITYTKIYNIQSNANLQRAGYRLYIPDHEYADKDCLYWIKHLKKKV